MVPTGNVCQAQAQGKARAKVLKAGRASSGEKCQRRKAGLGFCEQWRENYKDGGNVGNRSCRSP